MVKRVKAGQRRKICSEGTQEKKERFQDLCSVPISIRKGRVVSLVVVPLGLVVNLDSMKAMTFWSKEEG